MERKTQPKNAEQIAQEIKVKVPWGHVAAKTYGSVAHPRVLLVHGVLDNAGTFNRLISFLPTNYYYLSIDLPGHGHSSPFPPGLPLQYFDYVYTLKLLLDALAWDSCTAIGHSFGAQLLVSFTALNPDRIQKLILLDGIIPYTVETRDFVTHIRALYDLKSYDNDAENLYTKDDVLYALRYKRKHVLNSAAAEALFERSVTQVGDLYKYNRDSRLKRWVGGSTSLSQQREMCSKIDIPMLLILPKAGYETNHVAAEFVKGWLKNPEKLSEKMVVGNHDAHNNNPEEVAMCIRRFLNDDIVSKL